MTMSIIIRNIISRLAEELTLFAEAVARFILKRSSSIFILASSYNSGFNSAMGLTNNVRASGDNELGSL